MSDTGKKYPSSTSEIVNTSQSAWSDTNNIKISDNIRASSNMAGFNISRYIYGYSFNPNIPANATINGVEVGVEARCSPADQHIGFQHVYLSCNTEQSDDGAGGEELTANDANYFFGGDSDDWGLSNLTPANANLSTFTVFLQFTSPSYVGIVEIDSIWITVTYTDAVGNVDETVSFAFAQNLAISELVGGGAFDQVTFGFAQALTLAEYVGYLETVAFGVGASVEVGHDAEKIAARIVLSTGTIYNIELMDADAITEIKGRRNIVHHYEDNSARIYFLSGEQRRWSLSLEPNVNNVALIEALRLIETNVRFYPDYYKNKGTFYTGRIDNRAPVFYAAGAFDKEKFLQLVIYEVSN